MQSALCKDDSPTLNDEATWLEAELAECSGSSDDEDDDVDLPDKSHNALYQSMDVDEDEYVTPEGSPLLSPANLMPPLSVAIMGLGIQDASLLLPGVSATRLLSRPIRFSSKSFCSRHALRRSAPSRTMSANRPLLPPLPFITELRKDHARLSVNAVLPSPVPCVEPALAATFAQLSSTAQPCLPKPLTMPPRVDG